jgi:hypothetical protein
MGVRVEEIKSRCSEVINHPAIQRELRAANIQDELEELHLGSFESITLFWNIANTFIKTLSAKQLHVLGQLVTEKQQEALWHHDV